jgi:ElaB/YqjD/DUF883 family membrane-anchored ribosome-binding protein
MTQGDEMAEVPRNSPVDAVAEQARTAVDRIADNATDAITSVRTSIHDTVNSVADRANVATQWTSDKIKARPYTAVAIALAVGYLLGRVGRHV